MRSRGWRRGEGSLWVLLVLLYSRPIAGSYLPTPETIHQPPGANNLRSRPRLSSYECHNLRERHDLTSMPPRGYLRSYVIFSALEIASWRRRRRRLPSSIPRRCISWFVGNTIWSRGRYHLRNYMATRVIMLVGVRDASWRVWSSMYFHK